jgi:hypothetical protein
MGLSLLLVPWGLLVSSVGVAPSCTLARGRVTTITPVVAVRDHAIGIGARIAPTEGVGPPLAQRPGAVSGFCRWSPGNASMDRNATTVSRSATKTAVSPEAVSARLEALRKRDLHQALPLLMLELDRILHAQVGAEQRIELMQCIKKPVLKAAAGLPKPVRRESPGGGEPPLGLTLEQRLLLLMTRNLRQALYELDRANGSILVEDDGQRNWVLQQTFRFLGRQLRYGIDWDRPWPKHTWQDLHDLFVYLVVRGTVPLDSGFSLAVFDDDFDAQIEYKRLLLLGLADHLTERRARTGDYYHLLKRWATDSRLVEPERLLGEEDVVKVEVTHDAPPRLREHVLKESFRGWVLRPADALIQYVAHVNRGNGRVLRFGGAEMQRTQGL